MGGKKERVPVFPTPGRGKLLSESGERRINPSKGSGKDADPLRKEKKKSLTLSGEIPELTERRRGDESRDQKTSHLFFGYCSLETAGGGENSNANIAASRGGKEKKGKVILRVPATRGKIVRQEKRGGL